MSKEVEIIFEDEDPKVNEGVMFHEKHIFTLHGYTMFDILLKQENFQYVDFFKRSVCRIVIEDLKLSEKWKHPLIIDMKEKIEEKYGMLVRGVFLNLYEGDNYAPYHRDTYNGNGVFTVSVGGARMLYNKNESTGVVTKHLLEDGDLFYFNNDFNNVHKHSIPKLKSYTDHRISVVFFV